MYFHRLKTTKINQWYFIGTIIGNFLLVFSSMYLIKYYASDGSVYQDIHPLVYVVGILAGVSFYVFSSIRMQQSNFFIKFDHDIFEYYLPGKGNRGVVRKSEIKSADIRNFMISINTKNNHETKIALDSLLYKDIVLIKNWFETIS